jgi:hypothetical protein
MSIYSYTYECIYRVQVWVYIDFFSLSFSHLSPCRPCWRDSRVRFHTHTHTHTWTCTCLLVVYDYNSSFAGRLRHRLVAPVLHGSATLTRAMLHPSLNISEYIWMYIARERNRGREKERELWGHICTTICVSSYYYMCLFSFFPFLNIYRYN